MKTLRKKRRKKRRNWFLGKYFPPNIPLLSEFGEEGLWAWTGRVHGNNPIVIQVAGMNYEPSGSLVLAMSPEEVAGLHNRTGRPEEYHLKVAPREKLLEYRYWLEGWHSRVFK